VNLFGLLLFCLARMHTRTRAAFLLGQAANCASATKPRAGGVSPWCLTMVRALIRGMWRALYVGSTARHFSPAWSNADRAIRSMIRQRARAAAVAA
jgi:hypothetical protein